LGQVPLPLAFLLFLFGGRAYVRQQAERIACKPSERVVGTLNGSRFVYFGRYRDRHIIRRIDGATGGLESEYTLVEFQKGDEPRFKKEPHQLPECDPDTVDPRGPKGK